MKEAFDISDDVLRLIERADRPPSVAANRVWDAIESTLDAPAAAPAPPPPAPAAARPGPGRLLLAAVPLLLLAGAGGFWIVRSEGQAQKPRASVSTGVIAPKAAGSPGAPDSTHIPEQARPNRPLEPAIAPAGVGDSEHDDRGSQLDAVDPALPIEGPSPVDSDLGGKPAKKSGGKSPAKSKPEQALGLEDELALMAKAREALHGGKHKKALRLLAEHASTFKDGVFAEERDFSRVVAACELDDVDKAKRFARQYRKAHPKGALGAKLGETCAGGE